MNQPVTYSPSRKSASRLALASLSLSMLLSSLGTSSTNVALPALADAMNVSFQSAQWVVLAYLLSMTSLIVSVGKLGDVMGRKRLLLAGIGLFTAASALAAIAPAFPVLLAARALQGLGAAVMMALTVALASETASPEKTGSAMGLLGTMSAVGTALGPSLGGILLAFSGWPAIFAMNIPLGAASFALAFASLPRDEIARSKPGEGWIQRFDIAGTVILAASLVAYGLAMTWGRGHFGLVNIALLLAALAGTFVFVRVEQSSRAPLIRLDMLQANALGRNLVVNGLVSTVMMATLVVGPFYLSLALGLGPAAVGLTMSIGPVLSALTGILAGQSVDRLGTGPVLVIGLLMMAAGTCALAILPPLTGLVGYIAAIAMLTPGYQLFQAANNTGVMRPVKSDGKGVVSGMLSLSRNLGLVTGTTVMGAVFALGVGSSALATALPAEIARGLELTFAIATLLVLTGLAITRKSSNESNSSRNA